MPDDVLDVPVLVEADFRALLQAHLPQGEAWPRDPDRELTRLLSAFGAGMAGQHAEAVRLMAEADPATTLAMLTDWETTVGLPDPCFALLDTLDARRRAVIGRLAARGGQSPAYFRTLAAGFGWSVGVTEYRLFRAGRSAAGDAARSAAGEMFRAGGSRAGQRLARTHWAHRWRVDADPIAVATFQAGRSAAGERLRTRDHPPVRCLIESGRPAHTRVTYAFPLPHPDWLDEPVTTEETGVLRAGDRCGLPLGWRRFTTWRADGGPVVVYAAFDGGYGRHSASAGLVPRLAIAAALDSTASTSIAWDDGETRWDQGETAWSLA